MMKRLAYCLFLFLLLSCEKTIEDPLPYARVSFSVDLRTWDSDLVGITNYKIFTKPRLANEYVGISGIFVVCGFDNGGFPNPPYYAYDLCCPYEAQAGIKVIPTDIGTAQCPHCKTVYDTANGFGAPTEGPSKFRLRKLKVSYKSEQEFYIYN